MHSKRKEEFKELRESLQERYTDRLNSQRIVLLEGELYKKGRKNEC